MTSPGRDDSGAGRPRPKRNRVKLQEDPAPAMKLRFLAGLATALAAASAISSGAPDGPGHDWPGQVTESTVIKVVGPPDEVQRLLNMTYMDLSPEEFEDVNRQLNELGIPTTEQLDEDFEYWTLRHMKKVMGEDLGINATLLEALGSVDGDMQGVAMQEGERRTADAGCRCPSSQAGPILAAGSMMPASPSWIRLPRVPI